MFLKIKKLLHSIPYFKIDRFCFVLTSAFFLVFIENIPTFINRYIVNNYNNYSIFHNITYLITESLVAFGLVLIILFLISFNKILLKLIVILLICISSIFIYILVNYKVIIDEILFANLMQANSGETKEILTVVPFLVFFLLGVLPSIFIVFFIKITSNFKSFKDFFKLNLWSCGFKKITFFIIIPLVCCIVIVFFSNRNLLFKVNNIKNSLSKYMPINYIAASYQYITKLRKDLWAAKNTVKLTDKYNFTFNSKLKNKPLIIVLVIGESARAKEQAYNGYYRDTNRYTKNIKGLVYLKNVTSCNTYTIWSVPCMLSYKTRTEFTLPTQETSLISVFKYLGFKTYWISTQTAYDRGLNPIFKVANEASEFYFVNSLRPYLPSGGEIYDGLTVNTLVKKAVESPYLQKLIVFQLKGSHIKYRERFPKEFMIYTPSGKLTDCETNINIHNDYDNSILYTDYILSELIKQLEDKNALLIYMSDHGESLPFDKSGFLTHGAPYNIAPYEQIYIAALMWLSNGMQKLLPNALSNIQSYSDLPISHDYIFSTLLGSIGVKSELINPNLNLCSEKGIKDAQEGKYH